MKEYLEAGTVRNVHGVKGDLTVTCLCDSTEIFSGLKVLYVQKGDGYIPYRCTRNQPMNADSMLVHLDGVESREEAVIWKGRSLFARREDLPTLADGTWFIADLIGLPVIDARNQTVYGSVSDVLNYGASDLYEITDDNGKKFLIPAVSAFVDKVDLESGIYITPIEGMFE